MLEKLRRPGKAGKQGLLRKIAYFFVFGAICLVFVFLGPALPDLPGRTAAAYVGKEPVYLRELVQAEESLKSQYKSRLERAGEEEARRLQSQIRERALSLLISSSLIRQGSEKAGFRLSDKELQEAIRSFPVFQSDGRFVYSQYLAFLKSRGMRAAQFEDIIRREQLAANWSGLFAKALPSHGLEIKKNRQKGLVQIKVRFVELGLGKAHEEKLEPLVRSGDLKQTERFLKGLKAEWQETKEFSPVSSFIPELKDNEILREAVLDYLPQTGLLPQLIKTGSRLYVVEVLSFRKKQDQAAEKGFSALFGFEKSGRQLQSWLEAQRRAFPVTISPSASLEP